MEGVSNKNEGALRISQITVETVKEIRKRYQINKLTVKDSCWITPKTNSILK